jgi:carbon monoxide dehydrogenase subunit G
MPRTRRERDVAAPLDAVWAIVGDPYQLARWWPRVERVERVSGGRFTEVLRTQRGRPVRADFRVAEHEPPRAIAWAQEVEGTPFERVLRAASVRVELAAGDGGATRATLTLEQQMAGFARFGGVLVRRASRRVLDEALDGLERAVGAG